MRIARISLQIVFTAVLVIGCSPQAAEVVTIVAVNDVPLVDPESVAGPSPGAGLRILGVLPQGRSLRVTGCRPRKSDIDIIVEYSGKPAVAFGGYRVERSSVPSGTPGAITSCVGLMGAGNGGHG